VVLDAVAPETYTYQELVRLIARAVRSRALLLHASPGLLLILSRLLGVLVGDVILSREEITGLMDDLLVSGGPPTGKTSLAGWFQEHHAELGRQYFSEVARHYR
jgi:hypothetical protein